MIKLLILGATGSIGTTCLNAIRKDNPGIDIVGVSAYSNKDKLDSIKKEFGVPNSLLLKDKKKEEISSFIEDIDGDIVLNAIAGSDGLFATLASLRSGKDVALANKESVVMGGDFLFDYANKYNRRIIPVDSEHSAIYNLLKERKADSLIITASGGPFIDRLDTANVTLEEALKHPTWKMGEKITIDSATLANKGLEVIEASYLFGFPKEKIEVTVHRQSIIHSMIRTPEGAIYAQLSPPDMALPIMAAITEKKVALEDVVRPLSFSDLTLTFEKPRFEQFPMLKLAYSSLSGGSYPIAYNAADEVAVHAFIEGRIKYNAIAEVVDNVLFHDFTQKAASFEEIMEIDNKARMLAKERIC